MGFRKRKETEAKKQGCLEDYEKAFPLLLTNALGKIEITIKTVETLADIGAN